VERPGASPVHEVQDVDTRAQHCHLVLIGVGSIRSPVREVKHGCQRCKDAIAFRVSGRSKSDDPQVMSRVTCGQYVPVSMTSRSASGRWITFWIMSHAPIRPSSRRENVLVSVRGKAGDLQVSCDRQERCSRYMTYLPSSPGPEPPRVER
jgi:hypothetical protein